MISFGRALLGVGAALLSSFIIIGTIALSLAEGELSLALARTPTSAASPTQPPPVDTPQPGEPTFTPSATIAEPSAVAAVDCQDGWVPYVVQPGDTLPEIANFYGVTTSLLGEVNDMQTQSVIVGTQICVPNPTPTPPSTSTPSFTPTPTFTETKPPPPKSNNTPKCGPYRGWVQAHTVRRGDTLYSLAITYKTTVYELRFANCLPSNTIRVGKVLWVPFAIPPTPKPSATKAPPTATPQPSNTASIEPPTDTPTATETPLPLPTDTPVPTATNTPVPPAPTDTSPPPPPANAPTQTQVVLPTDTPGSGE